MALLRTPLVFAVPLCWLWMAAVALALLDAGSLLARLAAVNSTVSLFNGNIASIAFLHSQHCQEEGAHGLVQTIIQNGGLDKPKAELESIRSALSRLRTQGSSDSLLAKAESAFTEVSGRLAEAEADWARILSNYSKHKHKHSHEHCQEHDHGNEEEHDHDHDHEHDYEHESGGPVIFPSDEDEGTSTSSTEKPLPPIQSPVLTRVSGGWSAWSGYSPCSATCGRGTKTRARTCSRPAPANGGSKCRGPASETKACFLRSCVQGTAKPRVDTESGHWSAWSAWDACSLTCGDGTQTRTRSCGAGSTCEGKDREARTCNNQDCPPEPGEWSEWTGWSTCNSTCGGGTQSRSRTCSSSTTASTCKVESCSTSSVPNCQGLGEEHQACDTQACQEDPIPGQWSEWSFATECNVTCGFGAQSRTRACSVPSTCEGHDQEDVLCTGQQCVKTDVPRSPNSSEDERTPAKKAPGGGKTPAISEPEWTPWTSWSSCSVSCGGGKQQRKRTCSDHCGSGTPRKLFGTSADLEEEERECNAEECPVDPSDSWSSWSPWSSCSRSCDGGIEYRTRTCGSGANCFDPRKNVSSAVAVEERICNDQLCDEYTEWSKWSECSQTCGTGKRTRYRSCLSKNGECQGHGREQQVCNQGECDEDMLSLMMHHPKALTILSMPSASPIQRSTPCARPSRPLPSFGMMGTRLGGLVLLCGGRDWRTDETRRECYFYDREDASFQLMGRSMPEKRAFARAVDIPQGWWITGGNSTDELLVTTVILDEETFQWQPGPDLPVPVSHHCIVQVNATHTFLAGGNGGERAIPSAFMYDWLSQQWLQMEDMSGARTNLACGIHTDSAGRSYILAVGGLEESQEFSRQVEEFDLATQSWTSRDPVPTDATEATFVQDGDHLVLVNPSKSNFLKWDEASSSFKVILGQNTRAIFRHTTIIPVSKNELGLCYTKMIMAANAGMYHLNLPSQRNINVKKNNCFKYLNNIPEGISMVGAFLGRTSLFCGGHVNGSYRSDYYELEPSTQTFYNFSLPENRAEAAIASTSQGWWITGGRGADEWYDSSLLLGVGTRLAPGPQLPHPVSSHCLVPIHLGLTFMAGGRMGDETYSTAFFFDWKEMKWYEQAPMNSSRSNQACVRRPALNGTNEFIMVAGGYPDKNLRSVERFDPTTHEWTSLPDLPTDVRDATFIKDGSDLILVNPTYGNIMRFDDETLTFKVIEDFPIAQGNDSTVIRITDEAYGCTF